MDNSNLTPELQDIINRMKIASIIEKNTAAESVAKQGYYAMLEELYKLGAKDSTIALVKDIIHDENEHEVNLVNEAMLYGDTNIPDDALDGLRGIATRLDSAVAQQEDTEVTDVEVA